MGSNHYCCSVTRLCPTLCDPMDCSKPGFPVLHYLPEFGQIHVHLILCCHLLLLPSIFPSIRVFSNELALCIRWPKYWSFSFSISPSNEYSELIAFQFSFSSVTQLCLTLCDPMDHSTPGLPVHHQLPESTQTHVHGVSDAIQPSYPLSSPSPLALNLSQHQDLF